MALPKSGLSWSLEAADWHHLHLRLVARAVRARWHDPSVHTRRSRCSRWSDPSVHVRPIPGVHDGPISAFTIGREPHYTAPDLLVLDEIGYLPCDTRSADLLLYNIISKRHEKRSTLVTTNLPFKQWSTVFPGAASVVALVDRFAEHCHVLDIDADSWRQKTKPDPKPRKR